MSEYPAVGNVSRLSCEFTLQDGVTAADPTAILVQVQPPTGVMIADTPVRDAVGRYHYDVPLTVPGWWTYRFIGTGAVIAQTDDIRLFVPEEKF